MAAAAIAAPAMAARPGRTPAATIAIAIAATEPSASAGRVALNAAPSPSARAGATSASWASAAQRPSTWPQTIALAASGAWSGVSAATLSSA